MKKSVLWNLNSVMNNLFHSRKSVYPTNDYIYIFFQYVKYLRTKQNTVRILWSNINWRRTSLSSTVMDCKFSIIQVVVYIPCVFTAEFQLNFLILIYFVLISHMDNICESLVNYKSAFN